MKLRTTLPGVAGIVGLRNDPLRGHILTVDGEAVRKRKKQYVLPGRDGDEVFATMKGRFLWEHPIIRLADGRDFTTGTATPPFLQIIAFLPVLFLFGGSALPIVLGVTALLFNLWVVRSSRTEAWKSVVILCTFVSLVLFMVFWAFFSAWVLGLFNR